MNVETLIRKADRLRTAPNSLEGTLRDLARDYRRMAATTAALIASCGSVVDTGQPDAATTDPGTYRCHLPECVAYDGDLRPHSFREGDLLSTEGGWILREGDGWWREDSR